MENFILMICEASFSVIKIGVVPRKVYIVVNCDLNVFLMYYNNIIQLKYCNE